MNFVWLIEIGGYVEKSSEKAQFLYSMISRYPFAVACGTAEGTETLENASRPTTGLATAVYEDSAAFSESEKCTFSYYPSSDIMFCVQCI